MTQERRNSECLLTATTSWARGRTAGGATEPRPRAGSSPRSSRWRSATVAHGRSCLTGTNHARMPPSPECLAVMHTGQGRRNGADDRIVELLHERSDRAASLVYTSDAKLRTRVKALGTQVMGSGVLLSQIATLRATMEPTDYGHTPNSADGSESDIHVNEELPTICTAEATNRGYSR